MKLKKLTPGTAHWSLRCGYCGARRVYLTVDGDEFVCLRCESVSLTAVVDGRYGGARPTGDRVGLITVKGSPA